MGVRIVNVFVFAAILGIAYFFRASKSEGACKPMYLTKIEKKTFFIHTCLFSQTWRNEFLVWKSNDFGGVSRVQFVPDEIWVPDISLFNK